jgi:hypothetical protein
MMESNPDIAEKSKELALEANPKLRIPEVQLRKKIEAHDAKFAELAEQRERDKIDARNAERERIAAEKIKASGFTKEEIEKVVTEQDLRGDKMIDVAIRLKQLERQQAEPGPADVAYGANLRGPRDMRPAKELRNMSTAQTREWAHNELVQGFADIINRQRAGR